MKWLKNIILLLCLTHLGNGLANPAQLDNFNDIAQAIYRQSGLTTFKVSEDHFKAAYKVYLSQKMNGQLNNSKPIITFVNFTFSPSIPRLFVVNVSSGGGAGLVSEMKVTHGVNSGPMEKTLNFSNTSGSLQSSLGFYKVTAFTSNYTNNSGNYMGDIIRTEGLSQGFNSRASERGIYLHTGNYISTKPNQIPGRSWGCFVVPPELHKSLFQIIKDDTLLYAFYDSVINPNVSSEVGLVEMAKKDQNAGSIQGIQSDPLEGLIDEIRNAPLPIGPDSSVLNIFGTVNEFIDMQNQSNDGELPEEPLNPTVDQSCPHQYKTNSDLCKCQGLANTKFDNVVNEANEGKDTSAYTGAFNWAKEEILNQPNPTYGREFVSATNIKQTATSCAAQAAILEPSSFNGEQTEKYASLDTKIKCQKLGVSAVDYDDCIAMIKGYDKLALKALKNTEERAKNYGKEGDITINGVENTDTQYAAHEGTKKLTDKLSVITSESMRELELSQKNLATAIAAMPTNKTIYEKCKKLLPNITKTISRNYQQYLKTIPNSTSLNTFEIGDPCLKAIKNTDTAFIQNRKAKEQAEEVLRDMGYKMEELEKKKLKLQGQISSFDNINFDAKNYGKIAIKNYGDFDSFESGKLNDKDSKNFNNSKHASNKEGISYGRRSRSIGSRRSSSRTSQYNAIDWKKLARAYAKNPHEIKKSNIPKPLIDFATMLKKGRPQAILKYMQALNLGLEDLKQALDSGIISAQKFKLLSSYFTSHEKNEQYGREIANKGDNRVNPQKNTTWQIEKNPELNIFEIITKRYLRKPDLYPSLD